MPEELIAMTLVLPRDACQLLLHMVDDETLAVNCSACGGEWVERNIHCWLCPWYNGANGQCQERSGETRPCDAIRKELSIYLAPLLIRVEPSAGNKGSREPDEQGDTGHPPESPDSPNASGSEVNCKNEEGA